MLSRQCTYITSASRAFTHKKFILNKKYVDILLISNSNIHLHFRPKIPAAYVSNSEKLVIRSLHETPKEISEVKPKIQSAISSEEVLEKYIAGMNTDLYQKNRVYRNNFMRVLSKVQELNFSTKKQGLLLLQCCTELMPDETPASRMALAEQVWDTLMSHTKLDVDHYNELLRVYIANNRTVTVRSFLQKMTPVKPTMTTYELILKALAEAGDINQTTEVISNMKTQGLPVNEDILNSLILCQGKAGNLQNIQEVLTMMRSLKIEPTIDTYTAIARALVWNKQPDFMMEKIKEAHRNGLKFTEVHIMEIVKSLAAAGLYQNIAWVLKYLPEETLNSPSISPYMQSVTTLLVFQNHPIAALETYKCLPLPSFGPKDDKGLHGRSLVRDCVKAAVPSNIIGLITQELMSTGRNPIALQNAAEAALQLGKAPLALDFLNRMKIMGIPIRPHYFWPILLQSAKSYGEKGIMNTLSTMVDMAVKPDYETIMDYTLPYVSFTSPQNLMKKFLETGLTVSAVLTPMMETLLISGQVRAATEICELFHGKVDTDRLIKPLLNGYLISADVKSTVHTLEDITNKAMDKDKDWVGRFLCKSMMHQKVKADITDILKLMTALSKTSLKISNTAADFCLSRLPQKYDQETTDAFKDCIANITDERIFDDGDIFDQQIPHPKKMNEESLRAHLNELEAKGMNTRGVLRKLLQKYCREGNLEAARDVAAKCQKEGVILSAGMKAAIFDLHVKLGELDLAEITLADINNTAPNFTLDEFKVIDFATLMVYRKKIKQAYDMINEQSKKRKILGGRSIEMNCWRLLDATAANGTANDVHNIFELLTKLNYCKPSNVLLGPLIRVHLKNGHLETAVNEFTRLSTKYNKTPLKHELICKILLTMNEGSTDDSFLNLEKNDGKLNKLVHRILEVDKKVHGPGDVQLTLIAALADANYKKTLRKMFLDPTVKFHPDALRRRCERFSAEKKVHALENIATCAKDLRHVDVEEIYELILDIHQRDDNYQAALDLWIRIQEADVTPSKKFVQNLCALLTANNRDVPGDLAILLGKQAKSAT